MRPCNGDTLVNRRHFLATTAIVSVAAALPLRNVFIDVTQAQPAAPARRGPVPFDPASVRQMAKDLAQKPFKAPDESVPAALKGVGYDGYRKIRFAPERALWRNEGLPFQLQMFHRGFMYTTRVDLYEVADGKASAIVYTPDLFTFDGIKPPEPGSDLGFAGFRIHAPINRPDYYDEVGVFLGASYFRAVAKGETYGLSARGLAINTADPRGEEFPAFKAFWIEKPQPHANSIVVHALLDSKSAAAAYRFTIRPGETTIYDVEMTAYPRADIAEPGIAPMTSMFFFGPNDRAGVDDFRPAVHDSDGLAIHNGRGEMLWRPLTNPADLQISSFFDTNPRNFGLIQRQRDFAAYQDLESNFQLRPSLRVEPIGDWGNGEVRLIEIPTREEVHDNIVAYWRPKEPLKAKGEYRFTYRLHWGEGKQGGGLARFTKTMSGAAGEGRLFVLDIAGDKLKDIKPEVVRGRVSANFGKISNVVTQPNPKSGGWRLSFNLEPGNATVVELRAGLFENDAPLSETWVYRWTP
jgi:glucans biosynthesis protein